MLSEGRSCFLDPGVQRPADVCSGLPWLGASVRAERVAWIYDGLATRCMLVEQALACTARQYGRTG